MRAPHLFVAMLIAGMACAATMEDERRDYILAHPHGWIELSIVDEAIPQVPVSSEQPDRLVRPEICAIQLLLDREPFARTALYPVGDAPPYAVDSGIRIPAPIGPTLVSVEYSGCDVEAGREVATTAQLYVDVAEDRIVEVHFDGAQLVAEPPREDAVVTLDDIYEAITGRKK